MQFVNGGPKSSTTSILSSISKTYFFARALGEVDPRIWTDLGDTVLADIVQRELRRGLGIGTCSLRAMLEVIHEEV